MSAGYIVFVFALVGYSIAIFASRRKRSMTRGLLWTFGIALLLDMAGTVFVCAQEEAGISWSVHTVLGFAALAIMAIHFVWAVRAVQTPEREERFHRYSLLAWLVWLASFFSPVVPYML